jgi:hypothetical protein
MQWTLVGRSGLRDNTNCRRTAIAGSGIERGWFRRWSSELGESFLAVTGVDRWLTLAAIIGIAFWSFQCGKVNGKRDNYIELRQKSMPELYQHVQKWEE